MLLTVFLASFLLKKQFSTTTLGSNFLFFKKILSGSWSLLICKHTQTIYNRSLINESKCPTQNNNKTIVINR